MWDTTKYASNICDVKLPNVEQHSSINIYANNNKSFISKIKYQISKKILNKQKVDNSKVNQAELIYMWGSIPRNSNKKFIVELDNPYSLAYYHKDNFIKQKNSIKKNLRAAHKITYLSEACKNHTLEIFGKEFEEKSFVTYPYMQNNYKKNKRDDDIVNLIFVGLNSRGKGGYELLEAFTHSKDKKLRLTFISNVDRVIKDRYKDDNRINILPPQSREKLLNEIYPKMDVMIFPSFYESFGVVLLEALSYGMAIITLNVYAIPEMVKDGYNGKLLKHPILKPTILNNKEIINCVDLRIKDFHKRYLENDEFYYGLYNDLKLSISEINVNYKQWQKNSLELFKNKFAPDIWLQNFKKIIE